MTGIPTDPPITEQLTDHDTTLVVRSLRDKATRLEKLAETVRKEGYVRSAQELDGDAGQIREHLIPDFDPQIDALPRSMAEARATVAGLISVRTHRTVNDNKDLEALPVQISAGITDLIYPALAEVYNRGRADGLAERDMQAASCIMKAIENIQAAVE